MFDWDRFKSGEIAVHCNTEEKANDFLKECDKKGMKWVTGENATYDNNYYKHDERTCYRGGRDILTFIDENYFKNKGIEIVKWEVKEMKELTFKEVIANIKEGEVWENEIAPISFIRLRADGVLDFNENEGINLNCTYKLKRKEYTFEEAFKALVEGEEVESCEGNKFKMVREYKVLVIDFAGQKIEFNDEADLFSIKEIKGKWYIND